MIVVDVRYPLERLLATGTSIILLSQHQIDLSDREVLVPRDAISILYPRWIGIGAPRHREAGEFIHNHACTRRRSARSLPFLRRSAIRAFFSKQTSSRLR